jgi:large subunit ribosomal protein L23
MPTIYTVIRRPLITEKGLGVKETEGTLVFDVAPEASKTEVKQAVEALFKVKVAAVRTANVAGKERRRGKFAGYRPEVDGIRTPRGKRAPCQNRVSRKGEGIYDSEVFGNAVKKSRCRTKCVPVLKLTQVGEMKILSSVRGDRRGTGLVAESGPQTVLSCGTSAVCGWFYWTGEIQCAKQTRCWTQPLM